MISCFKGKFRLTSPRGDRVLNGVKGYHHGIDLVGIDDTTVYSIADGKVRTGSDNSAGNYVCVTIEDGRRVYYFHLKSFKVKNAESSVTSPLFAKDKIKEGKKEIHSLQVGERN